MFVAQIKNAKKETEEQFMIKQKAFWYNTFDIFLEKTIHVFAPLQTPYFRRTLRSCLGISTKGHNRGWPLR